MKNSILNAHFTLQEILYSLPGVSFKVSLLRIERNVP